MSQLYRAVWRVSSRQQLLLIVLSLLVATLAAAPLKFQQLVINTLVAGGTVDRLVWLCAGFLGVVLLGAGLEFLFNLRISVLGERIVLLMRERLYGNAVHDTNNAAVAPPKRGTLVTMLAAEADGASWSASSARSARSGSSTRCWCRRWPGAAETARPGLGARRRLAYRRPIERNLE